MFEWCTEARSSPPSVRKIFSSRLPAVSLDRYPLLLYPPSYCTPLLLHPLLLHPPALIVHTPLLHPPLIVPPLIAPPSSYCTPLLLYPSYCTPLLLHPPFVCILTRVLLSTLDSYIVCILLLVWTPYWEHPHLSPHPYKSKPPTITDYCMCCSLV